MGKWYIFLNGVFSGLDLLFLIAQFQGTLILGKYDLKDHPIFAGINALILSSLIIWFVWDTYRS